MSSAAVGSHSGSGPLSLMSCVRESSPLQDCDSDNEKNVASKRRFWNPRKWFKRKNNNKATEDVVQVVVAEIGKDPLRSRSTSELSVAEEEGRRRSSSSMHPGLSVSHDSVFHSPNSGSDMDLDAAQSSSSLSISQPHVDLRLQTELSERLRLRRGRGDTSEDDEGLPHSPCNSPTASDGLLLDKTAIKDLQTKSHSTCSDGSLLSMDSYEDEDSLDPHSRSSSKVSLREKSSTPDNYLEFGPSSNVAPLNHSAAHHRVSVKPKRTHGAPRRSRGQQLASALPVTPEVNEESSIRSMSPETTRKESLTELPSMNSTRLLTEIQLKCSSLPPGLTAPGSESKLNRSKSNAGGSKSQDHFSPVHEDKEKQEKPSLFDRIFPRKSARKKKAKEDKEIKHEIKAEENKAQHWELDVEGGIVTMRSHAESSATIVTATSTAKTDAPKPTPAPRSGAASRQRVLPIDIPSTPDETRKEASVIVTKSSPDKSSPSGTSPLQAELENMFKHRQISISTSPPKSPPKSAETPPQSPRRSPRSPRLPERHILPTVISTSTTTTEQSHFAKSTITTTKYSETKTRNEEFLNKIKMPGLSSLQQRVLSLNNDDTDNGFKSMTEITHHKVAKPVTKSHSFKAVKPQSFETDNIKSTTADFLAGEKKEETRTTVTKAASLDSIKHLDDQIHFSEMKLELKKSKQDVASSVESKPAEKPSDIFREFIDSPITISGPSHTAIVNVTSNTEDFTTRNQSTETVESGVVDGSHTISIKEHQVSVTKIQVKRESTQMTQSTVTIPTASVPEFINKPLNRIEIRPTSNIVFSVKSPRSAEEQNRPKTLFNFDTEPEPVSKAPAPRRFSKENLEIIEKDDDSSPSSPSVVAITSPQIFKKPEPKPSARKSSVVSILPETPARETVSKSRSASLDSLKSESDKSSQDSLDKLEDKSKDKTSSPGETVALRRKSLANKKKDDEPELMKVFARRSLKLKDSDVDSIQDQLSENKTRDSDKENQKDSPVDERKKMFSRCSESAVEPEFVQRRKSLGKDAKKDEQHDLKSPVKEPLVENKIDDAVKTNNKSVSNGSPVFPKKNVNNIFLGQRAFSLNPPKPVASDIIVKKQSSYSDRKISDQWMSNIKNDEAELKDKVAQESIISNISPKGDFITEPKNFSQRKAEWEKRAQLAQKKTTP